MKTSLKKITSVLSTLTAAVGLSLFSTGCYFEADPGTVVVDDPTPAIADITIDPAATMDVSPGDGVGLFVEYAGAGHWNIFSTCDTAVSGTSCNFDLMISADPRVVIANVEGQDLNELDSLTLESDGSIRLVTDTDFGMNGVSFDAEPGATIEIDMLLDGIEQPEFIYAVSDGVLLRGVPSNPVDFTPASF